ncbi:isopropylmalate isomerase [Streptacidiphilus pinicola]|uniref:3-isopropylmalate dehydratase small subunit n=1 Tax=Streptacidiphilus pinicola TaxID=2219663 RepID=A0A2X0JY59_9ACTN|nr:isopropylmalate isomerase [Streptacidiphilus pinicola]
MQPVVTVSGTAIAMEGDDIDTDRIIPARHLKSLSFDALGRFVFEGDRRNAKAAGQVHPFDAPEHAGARVLVAGENFGCGSSREHAPQALHRWGIRAIAAVSFGEIFRGNSATIGLPCVLLTPEVSAEARAAIAADPTVEVTVDLEAKQLRFGGTVRPVRINESLRQRFVSGSWDSLTTLAEGSGAAAELSRRLPYLNHWHAA